MIFSYFYLHWLSSHMPKFILYYFLLKSSWEHISYNQVRYNYYNVNYLVQLNIATSTKMTDQFLVRSTSTKFLTEVPSVKLSHLKNLPNFFALKICFTPEFPKPKSSPRFGQVPLCLTPLSLFVNGQHLTFERSRFSHLPWKPTT